MCHVSCHLSLFTQFTAVFHCKALKYTFFRKRLTCYTLMTLKEKFDSGMHASWWGNPNNNNLEQKFSASSSYFPSAKSRYLIGCKVAATFDKGRFVRPLYGPIFQGSRLLWVTQSYSHVVMWMGKPNGQLRWGQSNSTGCYPYLETVNSLSLKPFGNGVPIGSTELESMAIELSPDVFGFRPSYSNTKRVDKGI